ncbi:MAG: aminotransferase class I/II-fold pyridoxal phosphate-dependent enzyme [Acidimicrobiales bacterium]
MTGTWSEHVEHECRKLEESGSWRSPRSFDSAGATDSSGLLEGGAARVVAFASNDYLGLTTHPAVVNAAHAALEVWGTGSGASRLVTGSRPVHRELEQELADWKRQERSTLFPTGFAANLGVLATFGHSGAVIFSDELNHASIVDGARLARAEVVVFRHGDSEHLDALLERHGDGRAIVVTDLVFSMDGDIAPIAHIAESCRRSGALLVIDEAHAVLGPDPAPLLEGVTALRVGTLSKALGSVGGFVAGPTRFVEMLENRARSYIFTTALPPADAAAALAALAVVRSGEGEMLAERLRSHVDAVSPGHPSPIVPVVLGSEEAALSASAELLEAGLWVPAIRPPTVPKGTSRLRVTMSASHREEDVARLVGELGHLRSRGARQVLAS